jgi:DNA-binding GntR family transcriptional regulator
LVRAALLMLSKDKVIQIVPDKGAFVAKPSAEEAREVFAVRRILEAALAREFVARATAADYKRIDRHLAAERKSLAGNDAQVRTRLLGDFHIVLAEVVGNGVLTEMMRELSTRSAVITMLYQSRRDAACSSDEHREFIEAARAGDVERAVTLMVEHLGHVEGALHFEEATPVSRGKDLVTALLA